MSDFRDKITESPPQVRQGEAPAEPHGLDTLRVEYSLTLEDVTAFLRYDAQDSPRRKGQPKPASWAYLIAFGLLTFLWAVNKFGSDEPLVHSAADILPVLFLVIVLFYFFGAALIRRLQLRALRQNPRLFERRVLEISPVMIAAQTESHAASTAWHAVEWIVEHGEQAFFYLSKTEVYILPKRAFANERQYQEFLDTARRYHTEARRFVRPEDQA